MSRYSGGSWLVSAIVNLTRRSDNGRINSSPLSRSPAIIRWQEGCPQALRIPVEDPDGDVVRCRWATYSESRRYPDSFPYGALDEVISCYLPFIVVSVVVVVFSFVIWFVLLCFASLLFQSFFQGYAKDFALFCIAIICVHCRLRGHYR